MDKRDDYNMGYHILVGGVPTPADMETWVEWVKDPEARRVALTEVGKYTVSTVFLWFDHSFGFGDAPLWFETMYYNTETGEFADYQEHYGTIYEASAGHDRVVAMVRGKE